jgi:hypothetical protein
MQQWTFSLPITKYNAINYKVTPLAAMFHPVDNDWQHRRLV